MKEDKGAFVFVSFCLSSGRNRERQTDRQVHRDREREREREGV